MSNEEKFIELIKFYDKNIKLVNQLRRKKNNRNNSIKNNKVC